MRTNLQRLTLIGAAVVSTIAAVACQDNRAISTAPVGSPAYGASLVLSGVNVPRGRADFILVSPDSTKAGRKNAGDSVMLSLRGLDTLENGWYTVWLGDSLGNFKRATGILTVIKTDTVLNTFGDPADSVSSFVYPGVSSFQRGGARQRETFLTTRAMSGLAATDTISTVLITIENTATATSPSPTRRPLWARRSQGSDSLGRIRVSVTPDSTVPDTLHYVRRTPIRFGNFATLPESSYTFTVTSVDQTTINNLTGRGKINFRDRVLVVNDSSLARPPMGYYYATFAIRRDTLNNVIDTVYLGPQTSPYPSRAVSLKNADSLIVDATVQTTLPPAILAASNRLSTDTIARLTGTAKQFRGFSQVYVTLESKNKLETRLGPVFLLRADVPGIVRNGR